MYLLIYIIKDLLIFVPGWSRVPDFWEFIPPFCGHNSMFTVLLFDNQLFLFVLNDCWLGCYASPIQGIQSFAAWQEVLPWVLENDKLGWSCHILAPNQEQYKTLRNNIVFLHKVGEDTKVEINSEHPFHWYNTVPSHWIYRKTSYSQRCYRFLRVALMEY